MVSFMEWILQNFLVKNVNTILIQQSSETRHFIFIDVQQIHLQVQIIVREWSWRKPKKYSTQWRLLLYKPEVFYTQNKVTNDLYSVPWTWISLDKMKIKWLQFHCRTIFLQFHSRTILAICSIYWFYFKLIFF